MLLKMLDWIFLAIFLVELLFFAKWKLHEGRVFFQMGWLEMRREDLLALHMIGAVSVILGVLIYHDNPGNASGCGVGAYCACWNYGLPEIGSGFGGDDSCQLCRSGYYGSRPG